MQHDTDFAQAQAVLGDAMRERRLITATYNSSPLTLAPQLIVLRNGAFYLGAVNPNKARRSDEEPSLGFFKIDGLSGITMTMDNFEPLAPQARVPARKDDTVIATLD